MNVIFTHIDPGLENWKNLEAQIQYLKKGKIKLPEIFIRSQTKTKDLFLIISGFHLEETSGPILLLDPSKVFPNLKNLLRTVNIVIFPVINQYGLTLSEDSDDKYLRYNEEGIEYNTYWADGAKKCVEEDILERRIINLGKSYKLKFVLSLHEDSTEPGNGYLWMNKITKPVRNVIQDQMLKSVPNNILKIERTDGFRRGQIEKGFSIVDAKDDSFENFMSEILRVPTLLSEAPFGEILSKRISFHKSVLESVPL